MKLHIRWMIRRDMPAVMAIENESFEYPWSEDEYIRCLRHRNCIGMVAELDGEKVVGTMIYELFKTSIEVLKFAVAKEYRGRGIGTEMVKKLIRKLGAQRRPRLTMNIRESNLAAQLFFSHRGFKAVNVVRGLYSDDGCDEDAYRFVYTFRTEDADADQARQGTVTR